MNNADDEKKFEKISVKKVIFVEKLATDCRPGPATLLKMDIFTVVKR